MALYCVISDPDEHDQNYELSFMIKKPYKGDNEVARYVDLENDENAIDSSRDALINEAIRFAKIGKRSSAK